MQALAIFTGQGPVSLPLHECHNHRSVTTVTVSLPLLSSWDVIVRVGPDLVRITLAGQEVSHVGIWKLLYTCLVAAPHHLLHHPRQCTFSNQARHWHDITNQATSPLPALPICCVGFQIGHEVDCTPGAVTPRVAAESHWPGITRGGGGKKWATWRQWLLPWLCWAFKEARSLLSVYNVSRPESSRLTRTELILVVTLSPLPTHYHHLLVVVFCFVLFCFCWHIS